MTQRIQHSNRTLAFTPTSRATVTATARPQAWKRFGTWFVAAVGNLARAIAPSGIVDLPESLYEDVGLGRHRTSQEQRSEFNRLDAQLHARFY